MKKQSLTVIAISIFLGILYTCSDAKKESLKILIESSIYRNFEMGENEWYIENPKDSVQLYVFEYGKGKDTILALHGGFGAEHRYLKDAFEGLYNQYYFIFYDQRGSLRSPCPVEKVSIQNHVSDIEIIRKEFGIKKLNLFGHSNGTTLATHYLKAYPKNVKGFVMTACVQMQYPIKDEDSILKRIEISGYEGFGDYIDRPEVYQEIKKIEGKIDLPESKKRFQIERINHAKHYIYDIGLWRKGKESYGAFFNYKAGRATTNSLQQGEYNNSNLYENHQYPITIIMGEKDMIDPGGGKFKYWTKDLSNVRHIIVKESSHDIWIDKPEIFKKEFNKAMNRYNEE